MSFFRDTLVEFFESNHVSIFSECLSGHIESVFLDKTNSFLSVDTTMSVTLAGGILSFMCEPNVFVAHISSLNKNDYSLNVLEYHTLAPKSDEKKR